MKNKTVIIVANTVLIIFGGVFLLYYFWFVAPEKKIAEECQGFIPSWVDFIECYGVVAINDGWDMDYLSLKDHIHEYEIARVYNQKQYLHVDGKVFVINRKNIENSSSNNVKRTYYQELFQNGKVVEKPYDNISDIPTYLIIDTQSGEVQDYKNISEMSQLEQDYFKEIEAK